MWAMDAIRLTPVEKGFIGAPNRPAATGLLIINETLRKACHIVTFDVVLELELGFLIFEITSTSTFLLRRTEYEYEKTLSFKGEIRNKFECPNVSMTETFQYRFRTGHSFGKLSHLNFDTVSYFELRISDLD